MLTRRPEKRRFRIDAPPSVAQSSAAPAPRPLTTIKLSSVAGRKRRQFRVGPPEASFMQSLAPRLSGWRQGKRRKIVTLGERRLALRLGLIASVALALLALVAAGLTLDPNTRALLFPSQAQQLVSNGAPSPSGPYGVIQQPLRQNALQPFTNLTPYVSAAGASAPGAQAAGAYLFDPQRGLVLYQKNADAPLPVASLTKLMTLLVAVDSNQLDQSVTVGPDAAALVNSNNSYMDLSAGEQLSLRELLYGLIVQGGNDAAQAIADAVGGDEPTFVSMMNLRARQLGLTHTRFVSADGLDSANVASASDMAKLAALVMLHPDVIPVTSAYAYTIAQTPTHKLFRLQSSNDLLPGGANPYAGANGLKTGFTGDAGYCMAFSAVVNGRQLIGVVLGEPSAQARDADAHALLDWGFAQH